MQRLQESSLQSPMPMPSFIRVGSEILFCLLHYLVWGLFVPVASVILTNMLLISKLERSLPILPKINYELIKYRSFRKHQVNARGNIFRLTWYLHSEKIVLNLHNSSPVLLDSFIN